MLVRSVRAAVVGVVMLSVGGAGGAHAADSCGNATLRVGASAALQDCRAYELVTPDANHANLATPPSGLAAPDGDMMVYQTLDAPEHANSGQPVVNYVRSRRDAVRGWSSVGMSPPLSTPVTAYISARSIAISADLSSTFELGDQPLGGGPVPGSQRSFVWRSDGTYHVVAAGGPGASIFGTPDYSHVYFVPALAPSSSDPAPGNNTYVWSEDRGTRLIGILPGPGDVPAPNGATFAGVSDDGKYVAFTADGKLYLRIDDHETVDIGASWRTVDPDPNPALMPQLVGVASDGSKVLFTSSSELTNDAYTGRSGGVATDAGRDLYSYDTATRKLTDLTVATNPADVATGANVQLDYYGGPVVRATPDGSHVYFVAGGVLADGATAGQSSLYVWHDGQVDFVADADGMFSDLGIVARYYVTPDGQHVAFASTDRLTGYDNTDPVTGEPHTQVFKATIGKGIECASCRVDGTRPTADTTITARNTSLASDISRFRTVRVMSDDGRRLFFQSTDAVLARASGGRSQVFEYADGKVSMISRSDGPAAAFVDASASGDDVFFSAYDDKLVANPNGGDAVIFDARVGGGFPVVSSDRCAGIACQPAVTPAPDLAITGSVTFLGEGNVLESPSGSMVRSSKVSVSKLKTIRGTTGSLRVRVPGKGRLTVSGSGLRTRRSAPGKAQTVTVRLTLTASAARTLKRKRSLKTKARVAFADAAGRASAVTLSVTFKAAGAARKGR